VFQSRGLDDAALLHRGRETDPTNRRWGSIPAIWRARSKADFESEFIALALRDSPA